MDVKLADQVHANLMEVYSWMGEAPGGAADIRDGELLFAGRSPLPFLNGALRSRRESPGAELLESSRVLLLSRSGIRRLLLAR